METKREGARRIEKGKNMRSHKAREEERRETYLRR